MHNGEIRRYEITPDDLGIDMHPITALAGGDAAENARIAWAILGGEEGARRDVVAANAGAALYVSGAAESLIEGVELARQAINSGAARAKLEELIAATKELA